jgi:CRISPR/Cas system CSM-associated protein Csm3 (group 7 of RAMP superfamily)
MKKYQLHIRLLSDMCVSDGGIYNSSLDIDICHDKYGFPYIPAKRIKGCLRECALELKDWGKQIPISEIFGVEGKKRGSLTIRNAYVEDYAALRTQAEKNQDRLLFHPQNILAHYSYIRTQTTVDNETGTAKDNSLRTMRVANKGLVFVADMELDEDYESEFMNIVSVFCHMGMSRTRGLGEVLAECVPSEEEPDSGAAIDMNEIKRQIETSGCLRYSIYLEEPVICKSADGGEAQSLDYIPGNRICGIVLQEMKKRREPVDEFLAESSELFFSNAYLENDGMRLCEVPATFYSVKNVDDKYVNKAYENDENKKQTESLQLNAMKHCYVGENAVGELVKKSVMMEARYHHRRPDDKSIGRAGEDENGAELGVFYQMESIAAGQSFQGYVCGTVEQLMKVAYYLSGQSYYSIGTSRSSEYGKVKITLLLDKEKKKKPETQVHSGMDLMIKLESPVIVYNRENVVYSTNAGDLIEEVNAVLGLQENTDFSIDKFLNYTSTGGFNVTWNMRKPTLDAFDKGTVLIYHFDKRPELALSLNNGTARTVIGERTLEGYGEISVCELNCETGTYLGSVATEKVSETSEEYISADKSQFVSEICADLWKEYIQISAMLKAKEYKKQELTSARPTISNMLVMCNEQTTWEGINTSVSKRYEKNSETKAEKLQIADIIIEDVEKAMEQLPQDFSQHYKISGWEKEDDVSLIEYLKTYLVGLKYRIRNEEKVKREGE